MNKLKILKRADGKQSVVLVSGGEKPTTTHVGMIAKGVEVEGVEIEDAPEKEKTMPNLKEKKKARIEQLMKDEKERKENFLKNPIVGFSKKDRMKRAQTENAATQENAKAKKSK